MFATWTVATLTADVGMDFDKLVAADFRRHGVATDAASQGVAADHLSK